VRQRQGWFRKQRRYVTSCAGQVSPMRMRRSVDLPGCRRGSGGVGDNLA
jgi:hypothetical protein